jgi:hypothetical protein
MIYVHKDTTYNFGPFTKKGGGGNKEKARTKETVLLLFNSFVNIFAQSS